MNQTSLNLRRAIMGLVVTIAPLAAIAYPDKPVEWVIPYPAGGGSDVLARILAEPMGKTLGQSLVINNKPGAATNIGAEYVSRAKPDGYTILTADTGTLAINPTLYSKLNYKAERDLISVGMLARFPMVLVVNSNLPVKNYAEFLAWAKGQADSVSYASSGPGTPHHLTAELFRERTGIKLTHIPYKGGAPAVQDVAGGQVPFMFIDSAGGIPFVQSGRLRAIGVASARRVPGYENVPTLMEQGLTNFESYAWQGIVVPKGTAPDVIEKVNRALNDALNNAAVKGRLAQLGIEALPGTADQMEKYTQQERDRWAKVIRTNNVTVD